MSKRKLFILAMVLCMVAILAIGGSLAYFTDTDSRMNIMTLGGVDISQLEQQRNEDGELEDFENDKPLMPMVDNRLDGEKAIGDDGWFSPNMNNVVDKIVTVKNEANEGEVNHDAYVRTILAFETKEGNDGKTGKEIFEKYIKTNGDFTLLNRDTIVVNGIEYVVAVKVYENALAPQEVSAPSLKQLYMASDANNEISELFGDVYTVLAVSQGAQVAGFTSAEEALNTAFGDPEAVADVTLIDWLKVALPGG